MHPLHHRVPTYYIDYHHPILARITHHRKAQLSAQEQVPELRSMEAAQARLQTQAAQANAAVKADEEKEQATLKGRESVLHSGASPPRNGQEHQQQQRTFLPPLSVLAGEPRS